MSFDLGDALRLPAGFEVLGFGVRDGLQGSLGRMCGYFDYTWLRTRMGISAARRRSSSPSRRVRLATERTQRSPQRIS